MNRQHKLSPLVAAIAACLTTSLSEPVLAQDELEETVVTATRTPVPLADIGAPVIVITRDDIERSMASDVSELLHGQAGLEISRNGGPGQTTTLFTRGTDSNHTVVLVDGVRINPGTIGGAALQNIAPESIERIEIVKGPRSSLYGTDAIGGVVQLFTRGASQQGFSAGATYGNDETHQVFADGAFAAGEKLHFGFGGSYAESEGIPVFLDSTSDRGYRNVTGRASLEFAATDRVTLRARAWRAAGRTEYADQDFFSGEFVDRSNDFENSVYSAEFDYRAGSGDSRGLGVRVTASRAQDHIDQLQANFAGFDFAHTRRDSLDAQVDLPAFAGHAISLGVQKSDEDTVANSFGTAFDESTSVTQAFVQDQLSVGRVSTRLAVGGVDHETFGSELTWNAEVGVGLAPGTRITLSGGKAFRAPDATDRFGFGGNPDLQPEVSRQVELSLRQKLGERQLLTVSAFDNRIRDLINFFVIDPNTFDGENRNIDRARIKGVELGWAFHGDAWHARAELTLQDPRDESTDTRLLRRARESASIAVRRDVGRFDVGMDVVASGNRQDVGFPTARLDSYALVNATLRYRATPHLTLQGRLENLFDEDYAFAAGYRTEGRAWTLGVRYSFD
jgi:vitamin B12 transporter